jgi:hypothetical protein
MPLQNRVRPDGAIVADPARGTLMGNRGGRLHGDDRRLGPRRWASRRWICCRLAFNGRRRTVMGPGYTELFFLDEVTALAAGHRPCFECRRDDASAFAALFGECAGLGRPARADEMDDRLHDERLTAPMTPHATVASLPDGAMFRLGHSLVAKRGDRLAVWSCAGYSPLGQSAREVAAPVEVLTPPSIVAVLARGYRPAFHESFALRVG